VTRSSIPGKGMSILLFSIAPRPAVGPSRHLHGGYREFLPPWLRPSRRRISCSPCNAEVRNEQSINSAPAVVHSWRGQERLCISTYCHHYTIQQSSLRRHSPCPITTVITGVMAKALGDILKNFVSFSVFLIYATNPANLRLHSSLTLTI